MSNPLKAIFVGSCFAALALGFTACQDSRKGQTTALNGSSKPAAGAASAADQKKAEEKAQFKATCDAIKSLKSSKDPADFEKVKSLEANLSKGALDAKWIMLNERLMDQANGVFVEIWKKLEPEMQTVPSSVFGETRTHLLENFTMEEGLPVLKKPAAAGSTSIVSVITRGDDCLPKSLELQIVDVNQKRLNTYATITFNTKGNFEWRFNSSVMPEGVGQRLQTLGQDVYCSAQYFKGGQLRSLNCIHLGQEGYEASSTDHKVGIEFDKFFYNLEAKEFTFEGADSRYSDLVNPDATYPKKEIKVKVDLGPIFRKYTKTPQPSDTGTQVDPRLDAPEAPATSEATAPAVADIPAAKTVTPDAPAAAVTPEKNKQPVVEQPLSATSQGDQRDQAKPRAQDDIVAGPGVIDPAKAVTNEKQSLKKYSQV